MSAPAGYRYTKEHEWLKVGGTKNAKIGISDYAQTELGDVVFVDLPAVGTSVKKGSTISTVESVKAVSDVYAPVDGTITKINTALAENPQLINSSPYEDAWMIEIEMSDPAQAEALFDSNGYDKYLAEIAK